MVGRALVCPMLITRQDLSTVDFGLFEPGQKIQSRADLCEFPRSWALPLVGPTAYCTLNEILKECIDALPSTGQFAGSA